MPGQGVLFALDQADVRQMLAFSDARSRVSWVANTIEERWDANWLYAIGAMWAPVHYCLHGSSGYPLEAAPAEAKAIFDGVTLGVPGLYSIDFKDVEQVRRIASALSRMRDDAVWARAGIVERKDYTGPRPADLQIGVVDAIHELAAYYKRAMEAGRAVIFTVDS